MARTGQNEASSENKDTTAQANKSFAAGQKDIAEYQAGEAGLESGAGVGVNPFKSADYLGNVNKLQSEALNTATDTGKADLNRLNAQTGGLNSSITPLAIRDQSLQKARLADQLTAERSAQDFRDNLSWQQQLLNNRALPISAQQAYYNTALGGRSSAVGNLTQLGVAAYGPYVAAINAAGQVASAGVKGGGGGNSCWIAAELYGGWGDSRTIDVRRWLNDEYTKTAIGRLVMGLYSRYGERVAVAIKNHPSLRRIFRPLFDRVLRISRMVKHV